MAAATPMAACQRCSRSQVCVAAAGFLFLQRHVSIDRRTSAARHITESQIICYRRPQLRRHRFENYTKRDQSLDLLCQRLPELGGTPRGVGRLCIAFGGGSRCSTGFGYPPVSYLRHDISTGPPRYMDQGLLSWTRHILHRSGYVVQTYTVRKSVGAAAHRVDIPCIGTAAPMRHEI